MEYEDARSAVERLVEQYRERSIAKLPPERDLAERLDTTRSQVRRVLSEFEAAGVLCRVRGRAGGAFIAGVTAARPSPERVAAAGGGRKVQRSLNRVAGVPAILRSQGFATGTRVIAAAFEETNREISEFLGLGLHEAALSVLRIRFADGEPLSLERMYVSPHRFPALLEHSMRGSLYELFEEAYGVTVGWADEIIEATTAPVEVAAALGVADGSPLIKLTRMSTDAEGGPFEYSVDLFRADRTRLTVHTAGTDPRVRPHHSDDDAPQNGRADAKNGLQPVYARPS